MVSHSALQWLTDKNGVEKGQPGGGFLPGEKKTRPVPVEEAKEMVGIPEWLTTKGGYPMITTKGGYPMITTPDKVGYPTVVDNGP